MGTYVLACFGLTVPCVQSVRGQGLIEDGDCAVEAVVGVVLEEGVRAVAGSAQLAHQRLVQVELRGDGAAPVEVQVVLTAQLALLA